VKLLVFTWSVKQGKAILAEAWTSPEGSGRLMLSDFKAVGT
jgi:hypothetical protein